MIYAPAVVEKNIRSVVGNNMQDFSKKMTIVVREDIASWQLTNTVGHIAAYLGNKMSAPFDTGKYFASSDGLDFPRNSQFPLVVLSSSKNNLEDLSLKLRDSDLLWIVYVQEMIDMTNDDEIAESLKNISSQAMDILGIGIFGAKEKLKEFTGAFKLWK